MRMTVKRRGDTTMQSSGIWAGTVGFQCPWAHPIWSEYLLLVYDLNVAMSDGRVAHKLDKRATHEFMLYAVAPETPINFEVSMFEQKGVSPLTPGNCGYQFTAESHDAAWDRVNELVDACYREVRPGVWALNPDTDYRRQWDEKMKDGWSLLMEPPSLQMH